MKTVVKMILPVAAFMLASAGAVGTKAAASKKAEVVNMLGYLHTPTVACSEISVNCQIPTSAQFCQVQTPAKTVYRLKDDGSCPDALYKVIP